MVLIAFLGVDLSKTSSIPLIYIRPLRSALNSKMQHGRDFLDALAQLRAAGCHGNPVLETVIADKYDAVLESQLSGVSKLLDRVSRYNSDAPVADFEDIISREPEFRAALTASHEKGK